MKIGGNKCKFNEIKLKIKVLSNEPKLNLTKKNSIGANDSY